MGLFTLQKVKGSKVNGVIYKVVTIARPWTPTVMKWLAVIYSIFF